MEPIIRSPIYSIQIELLERVIAAANDWHLDTDITVDPRQSQRYLVRFSYRPNRQADVYAN